MSKRANGEGESITLDFDVRDDEQAKALKMSQLLALVHGRRKQYLVAMLAALADVTAQTGALPSASALAKRIREG